MKTPPDTKIPLRSMRRRGLLVLASTFLLVSCATLHDRGRLALIRGQRALSVADDHASAVRQLQDQVNTSEDERTIRKARKAKEAETRRAEKSAHQAARLLDKSVELHTESKDDTNAAQSRLLSMAATLIEIGAKRRNDNSKKNIDELRRQLTGLEERVDQAVADARPTQLGHIVAAHQVFVRALSAILVAPYEEQQADFTRLYRASLRILEQDVDWTDEAQRALATFGSAARAQFGPWELALRSANLSREKVLGFCKIGDVDPPTKDLQAMLTKAVGYCRGFANRVNELPRPG